MIGFCTSIFISLSDNQIINNEIQIVSITITTQYNYKIEYFAYQIPNHIFFFRMTSYGQRRILLLQATEADFGLRLMGGSKDSGGDLHLSGSG